MVKIGPIRRTFYGLIYLFVFLFCSASSCGGNKKNCPDGTHTEIAIVNNSDIVVHWTRTDGIQDSVWRNNSSIFPDVSYRNIPPNTTVYTRPGKEHCWEYFFSGGFYKYYFFFSNDSVKELGWEKISGTDRGLLKKVKIDLEYLRANNFTIAYP